MIDVKVAKTEEWKIAATTTTTYHTKRTYCKQGKQLPPATSEKQTNKKTLLSKNQLCMHITHTHTYTNLCVREGGLKREKWDFPPSTVLFTWRPLPWWTTQVAWSAAEFVMPHSLVTIRVSFLLLWCCAEIESLNFSGSAVNVLW